MIKEVVGNLLYMCEMPEAYVRDVVMARKDHVCYECRGIISKGEKYHNHHGVWDGSGSTYKVCVDCESLRTDIDQDIPFVEERTAFGYLCESVFESSKLEFIRRFLETKTKRDGLIQPWMNDRFDSLINKEDEDLDQA